MPKSADAVTRLILRATAKARRETSAEPEPELTRKVRWPIDCNVGPGLEGAIACESKVGYVNGTKGWLIYRGYDIFELSAYSTFEEVSYLLVHGRLPTPAQLARQGDTLVRYRHLPNTLRILMSFPIEQMNTMSALRIGTNMMRQQQTFRDQDAARPRPATAISADEDSIPMEIKPYGEEHAIYEFRGHAARRAAARAPRGRLVDAEGLASCYHLIAGVATLAAAIARIREGRMPIEPDPRLSHAANLIYMMTGRRPSPVEERVMDVCLILHADHGMNASTFASLVVASTLSDLYFSVGSGIAALNGPLHGGANEQVLRTLRAIGSPRHVKAYVRDALARKQKIAGFGHRVYKAYDPRARILGPLAESLARDNREMWPVFQTAQALEREVVAALGAKRIFPNVDFYSGLVYACLGIPPELFTPIFAVSRVAGWSARLLEYLQNNRIFRPRAVYTGPFNKQYVPLDQRRPRKHPARPRDPRA
jgi:citrate synthase